MESRRKRKRAQGFKWGCYLLLLLGCTVLQTTPGFLQLGEAKPVFLLPLGLAVAVFEGEFAGALFGAVCGLMWDYTAGRTVGLLALELMILCFLLSVTAQLYLKTTTLNFGLISGLLVWFVLSGDHLFFYVMPEYSGALARYLRYVPLTVLMSGVISMTLFMAVRRIHTEFKIDTGII